MCTLAYLILIRGQDPESVVLGSVRDSGAFPGVLVDVGLAERSDGAADDGRVFVDVFDGNGQGGCLKASVARIFLSLSVRDERKKRI